MIRYNSVHLLKHDKEARYFQLLHFPLNISGLPFPIDTIKKLFRDIVGVGIFLFLCASSFAQEVKWNTAPQKGFVFQISNKEAQKLLTTSSPDTIFNGLLHTQIDTFHVMKGWNNRPAQGHFILANIVENKLHCEYTSVFPYQVFLLKEYDALSLQVLDLDGNVREDAKVKFKLKRIRLDPESKTYRIENEWVYGNDRIVTVELNGFRSVFNIKKHDVPSWNNDYYDGFDGPSFYSYMITDKNRYKPNEKIRFKSYALSQSRSPLRRELEIWLAHDGKSNKIGLVEPHRPGSYASEFILHDSLKLMLDKSYNLQLREKNGRIVSRCHFKYEDYELNGNKLEIHLTNDKQFHPAKNEVSILATDANGLVLKGARASILVSTQTIRETFQPFVILKDTLLFSEIDLDPGQATMVDIPSGLFKKTNTTYEVRVSVNNSQNQRMERSVFATHYYSQYELTTRFSNDSIIYELLNNGEIVPNALVNMWHNDESKVREVSLPYKEKLNPVIITTHLKGVLASREISMRTLLPKVEVLGGFEKDSLRVLLVNPQKLEVSWYIYQGGTLLQKGFGKELEYAALITDRTQTYYIELLYSFGGEDHLKRKQYEFKDEYLNVSLDFPGRVYPGQQVDAAITVTNQLGDPVNGVDLTALAVNAKLNYVIPDLPYYGNSSTPRSQQPHYSKSDVNKRAAMLDLDYKKWKKRAGLDTMKYYQFTYPQGLFSEVIALRDSTQFAPYVMQHGAALEVYVVELNRKPIYYSWVDQPKQYSFYAPVKQKGKITLRLYDRVLEFDSLLFAPGKKTILSVDLDHLPENIKVYTLYEPSAASRRRKKTYPAFTQTEIDRHMAYISSFKYAPGSIWLESGKQFTPLFHTQLYLRKEAITVGPVTPGKQTFTVQYGLKTTYQHTGGYTYAFEDNIVYKLEAKKLIPDKLYNNSFKPMTTINDNVMTRKVFLEPHAIDSWHTRVIDIVDYATRVKILLPEEKERSGFASLFFENSRTKEITSPCENYLKGRPKYFTIPRGLQNVIAMFNNGSYLKMDSIDLQSFTKVLVDLNNAQLHASDSISRRWSAIAVNNCYGLPITEQPRIISLNSSMPLYGNLHGTIYDEANMPLPGCNVVIKGTTNGAISNVDGQFALDADDAVVTLVVSFIGYVTKEIEVQSGSEISLYMEMDIKQLSEVVVLGYGNQKKSTITASLALRGMSSGVTSISQADLADEKNTNEDALPEADQREVEQRLYQELLTLNSIRSNFSDVGFWEPKLFTDRDGRSTFTVTLTDDMTRWDATVYAMNRQLQTGTARMSIKSYKPLMSELFVPQFLTRGDSAYFIGKVTNFGGGKNITGRVVWSGGQVDIEKEIQFDDFYTDKLAVQASRTDSITARYVFRGNDGYVDGEERTVPVVEQGIIRAEGTVSILQNKQDAVVKALAGEHVILEFVANQLDIYAGEAGYLLKYHYDCNEQLASKLLGLINYRVLMQYEGKPFKYDKDVNRIVGRLLKNQNQEFLWSWWNVSSVTSYWMSSHILRALKAARDAGYTVDLDIENIARKAEYKFDMLHQYSLNDIDVLNALATWNVALNYPRHIKKLDSILVQRQKDDEASKTKYPYVHPQSLLNEKLLILETKQLTHSSYQRDSLLRYQKDGILGEVHFSDAKPSRYWYTDELAANAIAYRIVKRDSALKKLKTGMQVYFIGQRNKRAWNTYHSSTILTSVLSDLVTDGVSKKQEASIRLTGKVNSTIDKFPYKLELLPQEEVRISKESGLPVYFVQYTEERVTSAKTGVEGFEITTRLEDDQATLEAGKPVSLVVEVTVKKEANLEYVMIEIPIPGACSYADKTQKYNSIETHREYFKERTVIFCENMRSGKYSFAVQLLPRFTGKYMINPAQVSLMYVPVVNANTDMKTVTVK